MPRRPRPASRRPPKHVAISSQSRASKPSRTKENLERRQPRIEVEAQSSGSDTSASEDEGFFEDEEASEESPSIEDEDDFDVDAEPDAARVAQWVDEEELDETPDEDEDESDSADGRHIDGARLEADLHSLSFGVLRKAQKALSKAQAATDSEDDGDYADEVGPDEEESVAPTPRIDKSKEKEESKQKKEIPRRKNKHAPVEMSSKRPVSRSRFVAEEKATPRDPRFIPVTGEYDAKRFHSQYGFLADMHKEELSTLKENLKRARKLLANSPRDLQEERAAEVERLERAVKRAESTVNKDRREKVEVEALSKVAREERERQKQGKKAWYMKDADKKALLLRAKYDALAESGGRGAVRKAIEKKQKKINQKEKKKRPFVAGQTSDVRPRRDHAGQGEPSRKRPRGSEDGGSRKRSRPA